MIILLILIIVSAVANTIMFVDNNNGLEDRLRESVYVLSLGLVISFSFVLGIIFTETKEYKKELKPILKINCVDSKCDTTYVYQDK
jgi:hypothetical protein